MKAEKEKERLLDELDFQRADRATQMNKIASGKSMKGLRGLAKIYNVKGRSKAKTKDDLIRLLDENYAERKQAAYERCVGAWDSEIRANEEIIRWQREILEEERRRRPNEPARPKLIKEAMNGRVQKWLVDGSEYKDPDVFLYDSASGVKETVDSADGPKKVNMNLSCILEKEDSKTGNKEEDTFGARSGTHTVTILLGETYDEMKDKMRENLSKFQKNGSGWRLKSIIGLEIGVVKFDTLSGSAYSKLPPAIMKKKTINHQYEK